MHTEATLSASLQVYTNQIHILENEALQEGSGWLLGTADPVSQHNKISLEEASKKKATNAEEEINHGARRKQNKQH
jgi:hypothetical protein